MPKPGSVAALTAIEDGVRKVAKKRPQNWREGVTLYLDEYEDGQVGLLSRADSEFDQAPICRKIKAIRELKELIRSTEVDISPSVSSMPEYTDSLDERIWQAAIVTPPGWQKSVGALLDELGKKALDDGINAIAAEVRSSALALMQEIQGLHFYLSSVESDGANARAEQLDGYRRSA